MKKIKVEEFLNDLENNTNYDSDIRDYYDIMYQAERDFCSAYTKYYTKEQFFKDFINGVEKWEYEANPEKVVNKLKEKFFSIINIGFECFYKNDNLKLDKTSVISWFEKELCSFDILARHLTLQNFEFSCVYAKKYKKINRLFKYIDLFDDNLDSILKVPNLLFYIDTSHIYSASSIEDIIKSLEEINTKKEKIVEVVTFLLAEDLEDEDIQDIQAYFINTGYSELINEVLIKHQELIA